MSPARRSIYAAIAQLVEHETCNFDVGSSTLSGGFSHKSMSSIVSTSNKHFYLICGYQIFYGLISLYVNDVNFECKQKAEIKIQKNDIYIDAAKKIISILKEKYDGQL